MEKLVHYWSSDTRPSLKRRLVPSAGTRTSLKDLWEVVDRMKQTSSHCKDLELVIKVSKTNEQIYSLYNIDG